MADVKEITFDLWSSLAKVDSAIQRVTDAAIIGVLDAILSNKGFELAFKAVMIANNTAATYKNTKGQYVSAAALASNNNVASTLLNIIRAPGQAIKSTIPGVTTLINQSLASPNIAGIPIGAAKVETNKDVEIAESMVIVQSSAQKKYWTDNAVPRLKEWIITGYLTSMSPLDTGIVVKPSLSWQLYYLNECANSRRPVLFKTSRNEFIKVQITNLHTTEEASYNNCISVSISLKEYNPYTVSDVAGSAEQAILQSVGGV